MMRRLSVVQIAPWVLGGALIASSGWAWADETQRDTPAPSAQPARKHVPPKRHPPRRAPAPTKKKPEAAPPADTPAPRDTAPPTAPATGTSEAPDAAPPPPAPPAAAPLAVPPASPETPADACAACDEEDDEDTVDAEDSWKFNLGAEAEIDSRFVWRGLSESRGAVLAPSAWAGMYGLTAMVWTSVMLVYEAPRERFSLSAADASLSYAHSWDRLRIEPAITYFYWSPDLSPASTAEAAVQVSYKIGDFRIVSGNNFDIKRRPGAYFGTVGGAYARVSHQWTIKAFAEFGWATAAYNNEYLARDIAAVNLFEGGVSARYDFSNLLYFSVHTEASTLVALTLQHSVQEPTLVVGGAAFGVEY